MKYRLMDLLACPICKHFPLQYYVFSAKTVERSIGDEKKPLCELFCSYKNQFIKDMKETPPCEECFKYEIIDGLLYCPNCKRWYPIIDEIPRMLPDKLRKKDEDLNFMKKYKDKIPKEILDEGLPFNLKSEQS
ncbi:Trm112 family protein [Sulfurisphaera javensis]|uniref:Trm112 family protein n=1 Tax=Sulfurisphaera javensis TaxID=2049879 RepID=A0AAT9GQP8_9CREN